MRAQRRLSHDKECGLYAPSDFLELLYLERRRAERSKKKFFLMLINIEKVSSGRPREDLIRKLKYLLSSQTRETDIKGWYKYDSDLGVIFTETNGCDKESLRYKMHCSLCNDLSMELVNKIEMTIHCFPEEDDDEQKNGEVDLTLYPDLVKKKFSIKTFFLIKRIMDIFGSMIVSVIFSPFFLVIPLLIKATSDGPILFRQERIGQYGKRFIFLKFRTMFVNNNEDVHQEYVKNLICGEKSSNSGEKQERGIYKMKDDPRITPLGRILRKTSLDELPQLFNVLKSEMSLVGPRPPLPYEIEYYDTWHRSRVIEMKPGITGLWQVMGRSSTTFEEMVRLDLEYAREWSLWLDIKILFRTPVVVLTCKGAY